MDNLPEKVKRIDVLRIEHNSQTQCRCKKPVYELDTNNRFVYCAECGAIVDAFDALYKMAKDYERINRNVEAALKQAKELAAYKPHLRCLRDIEKHHNNHLYPLCPNCSKAIHIEEINSYTANPDFERKSETDIQGEWIQVDETKRKCSHCQTIFTIYAYPDCITSICPHCGTKLKEPIYKKGE